MSGPPEKLYRLRSTALKLDLIGPYTFIMSMGSMLNKYLIHKVNREMT
jgi:hypothetical protein